jgi:hypothetical protein
MVFAYSATDNDAVDTAKVAMAILALMLSL